MFITSYIADKSRMGLREECHNRQFGTSRDTSEGPRVPYPWNATGSGRAVKRGKRYIHYKDKL